MKKKMYFLLLLAFVCLYTPAKAILVNIPDANFRTRLQVLYPACFVGVQMETTCTGITSATGLNISNLGITNLIGIEHFISLQSLNYSGNSLTSLPTLPTTLTTLNCSNNGLTSLPVLPTTLTNLNCSINLLMSLPALPTTLTNLNCSNNGLTSLPVLPTTLTNLNCSINLFISLPALPATLTNLNCSINLLMSLANLPTTLTNLNCFSNQLASLPVLPANLTNLNCENNLLTSLPVLPASLTYLDCSRNQLTSLLPLPTSLTVLNCGSNQLTSLPPLPTSLISFNPLDNQLDFADLEAINPRPPVYSANPQNYKILPSIQSIASSATLTISGSIGGSLNVYQWYKDNVLIPSANSATYTKIGVVNTDEGVYKCVVTSSYIGLGTTTGVIITSSNVTITVRVPCPTIIFTTTTATDGVIGTPYTLNAGATGATSLNYSVAPLLPAGLTLNTATGTISGTPTTIKASTSYIVTATQSGVCASNSPMQTYTFAITQNPTTSTDNALSNQIKVFPNPSNGDFKVDFSSLQLGKGTLRVYDAQGKQVIFSEIEKNTQQMPISLENKANGIYLLEISSDKGRILKKLVKE